MSQKVRCLVRVISRVMVVCVANELLVKFTILMAVAMIVDFLSYLSKSDLV